ncbi:MAG: hybrid histidine kinase/response regulator HrmK [Nostocaceae cyanobacterium]|nr:hybrid histidine kinase/response regulator HrmK [Nostocaceae cyanobacterium]
MQQYSSLPEQNSRIDEMPTVLATIEQLRGELWLERCLNQLQSRFNDCLLCAFVPEKETASPEAIILQTLVDELTIALKNTRVAIVIFQPAADVGKVSYVCSLPEDDLQSSLAEITLADGKKLQLQLQQQINIEDLQQLEQQQPQLAWRLTNDSVRVMAWLITAKIPLDSDYDAPQGAQLQLNEQFIHSATKQCAIALTQLRKTQSLQQTCENLEKVNQELERTNLLKNQFLANTSHEIRTPLSSILGFTQLLLAQGYNPERERHQEYLNIMLSSGRHLLELINDILDLSKIEANQLEIQWDTVEIAPLCQNVLALVKEKAANKGLKLQFDIDSNITTLIADSLRLKQMLLNLLFNALKFTSTGAVGLQVQLQDLYVHFTVWDTGVGISPEQQSQLFQPYCQIANGAANREEGTGLGLVVTSKLAQLQGGWIEVESQVNQGSRFTIVLPLNQASQSKLGSEQGKQEHQADTDRNNPPKSCDSTESANILLVEDHIPNAQMIQTYLKKLGYQVNWVKNISEMWTQLRQIHPTVILIDVKLPDGNGLEVVQQLREDKKYNQIPIIAQTAMAMKGDCDTCLNAGVNEYISKPINLSFLANAIAKYSTPPAQDSE